ncbi:MAG: hypothetical protein NXI31_05975 [bacterium]|nr:hypothetical protein [bacterium]
MNLLSTLALLAAFGAGTPVPTADVEPLTQQTQQDKRYRITGRCQVRCSNRQCVSRSCTIEASGRTGAEAKTKVEWQIRANLEQQARQLGGSIQGSISFSW